MEPAVDSLKLSTPGAVSVQIFHCTFYVSGDADSRVCVCVCVCFFWFLFLFLFFFGGGGSFFSQRWGTRVCVLGGGGACVRA